MKVHYLVDFSVVYSGNGGKIEASDVKVMSKNLNENNTNECNVIIEYKLILTVYSFFLRWYNLVYKIFLKHHDEFLPFF